MTRRTMNPEDGRLVFLCMVSALRACHVPYFLIQGTALGAYRDHGFTPTERDIDIGVLYEDFARTTDLLTACLHYHGFACRLVSDPFTLPRAIKAVKNDIKVDLSSYVPWNDTRFCANSLRQRPYSVVYDRAMMETYDTVELFGLHHNVPHPIEAYLELEYGLEWKTPKDDSRSRTRVRNFVGQKGIPRGYLETLENDPNSATTQ